MNRVDATELFLSIWMKLKCLVRVVFSFVISVKFTYYRIRIITSSDSKNNNYFVCQNVTAGNRLNDLFIVLVLLNL